MIMVVGILTALAMMGMAFLLTTWADKKEATALADAAPMRTLAESQVARMVAALGDDLLISGMNGPFTDLNLLPPADYWKAYADYPCADPAYGFDAHLASTELAATKGFKVTAKRWPKLTRLGNEFQPGEVVNVSPAAAGMVDTDGDSIPDAKLFGTGVRDRVGREYFVAVRLIDMSAFININTSLNMTDKGDSEAWMTPGMVAPNRLPKSWPGVVPSYPYPQRAAAFPSGGVYNERKSGDYLTDNGYYNTFVRRAENPASISIAPFDWSDELACRWIDTLSWSGGRTTLQLHPVMKQCRLARRIGQYNASSATWGAPEDWAYYGRYLTTCSASRILTDIPAHRDQLANEWKLWAKVDLNVSLADRGAAFDAYRRAFYHMLPQLGNERATTAAQMAVNLIDFRDEDDKPTVTNYGGQTIMGIERQPFITQAWYKVLMGEDDQGEEFIEENHMAIVLYNPYATKIELTKWKVNTGSATVELNETIAGKGRLVLCSSDDVKVAGGAKRKNIASLTAMGTTSITRPGAPLGGAVGDVPVGRIQEGDFPDDPDDAKVGVPHICNIGRDDNQDRLRMAVAAYVEMNKTLDYTSASIGVATGVASNSATIKDIPPTPVFVRGYGEIEGRVHNHADLGRIFTIGPQAGAPLDVQLRTLFNNAKTPAARLAIGRLSISDFTAITNVTGYPGGYPAVPSLCLSTQYFTIDSPLTDGYDNNADGKTDSSRSTANAAAMSAWNGELLVHGRININTAPRAVFQTLLTLPLSTLPYAGGLDLAAYRDRSMPVSGQQMWMFHVMRKAPTALGKIRSDPGYATAGEAAIAANAFPLITTTQGMYNNYLPDGPAYKEAGPDNSRTDDGYGAPFPKDDLSKVDMRYAYLSNVLDVRSDIYCAYVLVQLGDKRPGETGDPNIRRRYVAIIDRSNCVTVDDQPIVRGFAEVR